MYVTHDACTQITVFGLNSSATMTPYELRCSTPQCASRLLWDGDEDAVFRATKSMAVTYEVRVLSCSTRVYTHHMYTPAGICTSTPVRSHVTLPRTGAAGVVIKRPSGTAAASLYSARARPHTFPLPGCDADDQHGGRTVTGKVAVELRTLTTNH